MPRPYSTRGSRVSRLFSLYTCVGKTSRYVNLQMLLEKKLYPLAGPPSHRPSVAASPAVTKAFSSAEPMQAGAPPCSSQSSTQRRSEVERSGGTLKQVPLVGEGVQSAGQAVAARRSKRKAVARRISVAQQTRCPTGAATKSMWLPCRRCGYPAASPVPTRIIGVLGSHRFRKFWDSANCAAAVRPRQTMAFVRLQELLPGHL